MRKSDAVKSVRPSLKVYPIISTVGSFKVFLKTLLPYEVKKAFLKANNRQDIKRLKNKCLRQMKGIIEKISPIVPYNCRYVVELVEVYNVNLEDDGDKISVVAAR